VARQWSFGDGSFGSEPSGTHTFPAAGSYTIRLKLTDAYGLEDSEVQAITVRVPNVAPTAAFDSACVDLTCTFTNRSSDTDGSLVAHAWTFGTSGGSADVSPTFRFPAPGTYLVTLMVTDNEGATATAAATVEVRAIVHAAFVNAVITETRPQRKESPWTVLATVAVHGADERLVGGATIVAIWSGASVRTITCVTAADGTCTFASGTLRAARGSVTLTLLSVSAPLSTYRQASNHDPQGDPTGGSFTYLKP
jgi:PKD repeat protein